MSVCGCLVASRRRRHAESVDAPGTHAVYVSLLSVALSARCRFFLRLREDSPARMPLEGGSNLDRPSMLGSSESSSSSAWPRPDFGHYQMPFLSGASRFGPHELANRFGEQTKGPLGRTIPARPRPVFLSRQIRPNPSCKKKKLQFPCSEFFLPLPPVSGVCSLKPCPVAML